MLFDTILDTSAPILFAIGIYLAAASNSLILHLIGAIVSIISVSYIYRTIYALREANDHLTEQNAKMKKRFYDFPTKDNKRFCVFPTKDN